MTYPTGMNHTEALIIDAILASATHNGCDIEVRSGGEVDCPATKDMKAVKAQIAASDETTLAIYHSGELQGYVSLVHGNDGYDVIADYTDTEEMNEFLQAANDLAEEFSA